MSSLAFNVNDPKGGRARGARKGEDVKIYDRLKRKLNCQVDTSGEVPSSSQTVIPSWMILSMSTLHRIVWK